MTLHALRLLAFPSDRPFYDGSDCIRRPPLCCRTAQYSHLWQFLSWRGFVTKASPAIRPPSHSWRAGLSGCASLVVCVALCLGLRTSPAYGGAVLPQVDSLTVERPEAADSDVMFEVYRVLVDDFPLLVRDDETATPPLGRRNLQFHYGVAGALPSDSIVYRFRMEGIETNWIEAGDRSIAFYRYLKPGRFTFVVEAREVSGRWSRTDRVPVYIEPYIYERPWFYVLIATVIGLGIAGLFVMQGRVARAQTQRLALLVDERTRALQVEKERVETALEDARRARTEAESAHDEAEVARAEAEHARTQAEEMLATTEEQAIQLLRVDHLKSRLFANLSHEFRTPLTLIIDPLERAVRGELGDLDDLDGYARHVLDNARLNALRLLRLINQLLDLSRLEGGGMELRTQPHDLVAFIHQAVDLFVDEAQRLGVRLLFRSEANRLPLHFDAEKVEKILFNLLTNALKADADGGKVLVTVRKVPAGAASVIDDLGIDVPDSPSAPLPDDAIPADETGDLRRSRLLASTGYAEITVRDTGIGIEPEKLPHIFDRFYQAESGDSGTGIGLSLVKELVELHRGQISVDSQAGFGSSFVVRLPLGTAHLTEAERVPDDAPPRAETFTMRAPDADPSLLATQSLHAPVLSPEPSPVPNLQPRHEEPDPNSSCPLILVVDDHDELREMICSHLTPDYRVVEAANGEQALRAAHDLSPDLIVSDIIMPGMSGIDLCRHIREDDDLASIPVVLLTARASDENRILGYDTGADDYLSKPFLGEELRARVANLLRRRRTMRERFSQELVIEGLDRPIQSADAAFIEHVFDVIEEHLADSDFTVGMLADGVGMSQSQLKRRLRAIADQSPVEVIRTYRLQHAVKLIQGRAGTVSEIAYAVGFGSVSYFSKVFREHTGMLPSQMLAEAEADPVEPAG